MRVRTLSPTLLVAVLAGCASAQKPSAAFRIDPPIITSTRAFANINVEIAADGEWWKVGGYEGRVFDFNRHELFYDDICRPEFKVRATVARPKSHAFIREDVQAAEIARLLRERRAGVRVVTFDLASVTLDELEEEFLAEALPRLKPSEPSYSCYGWRY